jgi:hypothetical protein
MPPPPQSMPIQARAPAPTQGTEYATTARTRQTGGNNPDGHVLPKASSGTRSAAQRIVESAGFIIKPPPPIGRITPDVWAIGADEVLLVGSICPVPGDVIASEGGSSIWKSGRTEFISPVWSMASVQEQLRTLFMETLDEEMISISAFVIIDGGTVVNADAFRAIWNALGVTVFGGINEFAEYMAQNPNRAVASDEAENFREYGEYIDAVAKHFNTN